MAVLTTQNQIYYMETSILDLANHSSNISFHLFVFVLFINVHVFYFSSNFHQFCKLIQFVERLPI